MEHFILWGASTVDPESALTFHATRIQQPCIQSGSRAMLEQMLSDLEIQATFTTWTIRRLKNDRYAEPSESRQLADTWADTWQIRLELTAPISRSALAHADGLSIIRTLARDETWDGATPSSPVPFAIHCRFYNPTLLSRAVAALRRAAMGASGIDDEIEHEARVVRDHPMGRNLAIQQLGHLELLVVLGEHAESSFPDLGVLAEAVVDLVHELAATTSWDEEADHRR